MTEEPPKKPRPKKTRDDFRPNGVTGRMAWDVMQRYGLRNLDELRNKLIEMGYQISKANLCEKLGKVPEYIENRGPNPTGRPRLYRVLELVTDLQAMETGLRAKTWRGCRVKLITRLTEALETLKIETPEDVFKLLEADDKLAQLIHGLRGAEIDIGSTNGGSNKVSLFDSSNNLVPLPSYRTGANGNGNGKAKGHG